MTAPATLAPAYIYAAMVLEVHDGDTLTADINLGFSVHVVTPVRLLGCNARELSMSGGVEAGDNLRALLLGQPVTLRTVKPDKFGGRYDAQVALPDGSDLVTALIAGQWAAAWNGVGVKPVPPWPRTVG